eukprot:TRINITY_DN7214_c0_g1_i1.p1 TRINITY_DN7214_c0_g1~~TRINITY_DN7214_c0_g1_i1.p1  ORF type:complete len:398 (-),score=80.73 TRINITY_DN7214_c0_g1_i1:59-1252(-)
MSQEGVSRQLFLYVGTYTRVEGWVPFAKGQGVHCFKLEYTPGKPVVLNPLSPGHYEAGINPGWIVANPAKDTLYVARELDKSTVNAFTIDRLTGTLTDLHTVQDSTGPGSCHAITSKDGKFLFLANYLGGNIAAFPLLTSDPIDATNQSRGTILPAAASVKDSGELGPNPARQDAAHAHSVTLSQDESVLFVSDLGFDSVLVYQIQRGPDLHQIQLIHHQTFKIKSLPGCGTRHLVVHPTNPSLLFAVNELSSSVSVLKYDTAQQMIVEELQSISTLNGENISANSNYTFNTSTSCAEIQAHENGRFLYVSNRGDDSIAIFEVENERLKWVGKESTRGKVPRHFLVVDGGRLLIVGNQDSDTLVFFDIDQEKGILKFLNEEKCATPVCMVTVPLAST